MIGNYWNSAWRNLMKRKKFSFIKVSSINSIYPLVSDSRTL